MIAFAPAYKGKVMTRANTVLAAALLAATFASAQATTPPVQNAPAAAPQAQSTPTQTPPQAAPATGNHRAPPTGISTRPMSPALAASARAVAAPPERKGDWLSPAQATAEPASVDTRVAAVAAAFIEPEIDEADDEMESTAPSSRMSSS